MIELEFFTSNRKELIGPYKNFANKITLGSSQNDSIIIEEEGVPPSNLKIEITTEGLWAENRESSPYYHVNGKKISGRKLLQVGDQLRIGETSFKITAFESSSHKLTKDMLLKQYDKVVGEKPDLKPLLECIENELVQIQYIGTEKKATEK